MGHQGHPAGAVEGTAPGASLASSARENRRERRRVGSLLNTYYAIEQAEPLPRHAARSELDAQGFDAKQYFDAVVASGHVPDLVKRSRDLDIEIKELDSEMQTMVYENYTKFIRAAGVVSKMKVCIDSLEPDIRTLQGNIGRMTEYENRAEEGIANRSQQMEALLKQQRMCKKLQLLVGLPATLQRCREQGAYVRAANTYHACVGFLEQHRNLQTFQGLSDEVEQHMSLIRFSLEQRLRCADLPLQEAEAHSALLLRLGENRTKVAQDYFYGRAAALEQCLDHCFAENADDARCVLVEGGGTSASASTAAESASGESAHRSGWENVCSMVTELYVPNLNDAAQRFPRSPGLGSQEGGGLGKFVATRVDALLQRLEAFAAQRRPTTRVLTSCLLSVRDSFQRLQPMWREFLARAFASFSSRVAADTMQRLFAEATSQLLAQLCGLHRECEGLEQLDDAGLGDVLQAIARTEQALITSGFAAISACEPLLDLLGSDHAAARQLVRGLNAEIRGFFLTFAEGCHVYVGRDPDAEEPGPPRPQHPQLVDVARLRWNSLFALGLVRIGRHLEVKVVDKVWRVAQDLFADVGSAAVEPSPNPTAIKEMRVAAGASLTRYALVCGQQLAHLFRDTVRDLGESAAREQPRDALHLVGATVRQVQGCEAQLAVVLGDPRKPKRAERRTLELDKNSMELELERRLARKLPVFAPIAFNRNGAVVGILRIAFKALSEYLREERLGKYSLQQVQVDCAFLDEYIRDFVEAEDASMLSSLLSEVVTSASRRCAESALLDDAAVDAAVRALGPLLRSDGACENQVEAVT